MIIEKAFPLPVDLNEYRSLNRDEGSSSSSSRGKNSHGRYAPVMTDAFARGRSRRGAASKAVSYAEPADNEFDDDGSQEEGAVLRKTPKRASAKKGQGTKGQARKGNTPKANLKKRAWKEFEEDDEDGEEEDMDQEEQQQQEEEAELFTPQKPAKSAEAQKKTVKVQPKRSIRRGIQDPKTR